MLVKPVAVTVERAGAISLDVIQEVEYVKPDSKIVFFGVLAKDRASSHDFL